MKSLTSKERLTRCFYHMETDRPAIYSRTSFPHSDSTYDDLKRLINEKTDLKSIWQGIEISEYQLTTIKEDYRDGYIKLHNTIATPRGNLSSTRVINLQDSSSSVTEYFIKNASDIEKYLSLPFPEIKIDPSKYFEAEYEIGDRGIVIACLGSNPAGYAAGLCGSETFALLSVTDRELLYELCERRLRIIMALLRKIRDNKIGHFFAMQGEEYVTPPLHGKKDFYDFNVRYDKQIIDFVHEIGGKMHIHCHGPMKQVLEGFIDMGVYVLHPFEAPPMGDITTKEAKEMVKGKICIEGNIEISLMYERTPKEIREITLELIKDAFYDKKGLIVSPTASPCFYGKGKECYDQYKELIDTVISYT